MSPFKPEDIAYLAGLFEGEGTFFVDRFYWYKGEKRPLKTLQPQLRIAMTDVEPLERLQSVFGGNLYGPYKYERNNKPFCIWEVLSPPKVKELIELLWPWLSPRRRKQVGEYHVPVQE